MKMNSVILTIAAILATAGCNSANGVRIDAPSPGSDATVSLQDGTTSEAVAAKLQTNGFYISRQTPQLVTAVTQRPTFVNCGVITQVRNGNRSRFPGATPLSVIYTDPDSQDFLTREVSVTTTARIALAGSSATVYETHDTTMVWTPSNKPGRAQETRRVSAGETVTFSDNTTCATGSSVADILR